MVGRGLSHPLDSISSLPRAHFLPGTEHSARNVSSSQQTLLDGYIRNLEDAESQNT